MDLAVDFDRLLDLRRELHRHPEPAWREFYTTARLLEALDRLDVDRLAVGSDALSMDDRLAVPEESALEEWVERARAAGGDPDVIDRLADDTTGILAVLDRGDGPTVGLRVDIDGLPVTESTHPDHVPAAKGFRSETEGYMHACGHDAHAAIGVGVLEAIAASDFSGTLKVLFQPAEEQIGGGKAVAESGHLDDVEYLLAVHVGLGHPAGEVVAGMGGFLAVSHFRADFEGESAHAGGEPNRGRNAVQAMATAVQNLYAIPRHEAGATRVNAGEVGGGTAPNVVPESAYIEGEVRGETTALMTSMRRRAFRVIENAASMHGCTVEVERGSEAPSARSDDPLVDRVLDAAGVADGVDSVIREDQLGGSEDATYLMNRVQEHGGLATYVGIGTDHPGGHHTPTFDVSEDSIRTGVDVLARTIVGLTDSPPG
jgi:aminobenzoyl-glutamate utilization protein A